MVISNFNFEQLMRYLEEDAVKVSLDMRANSDFKLTDDHDEQYTVKLDNIEVSGANSIRGSFKYFLKSPTEVEIGIKTVPFSFKAVCTGYKSGPCTLKFFVPVQLVSEVYHVPADITIATYKDFSDYVFSLAKSAVIQGVKQALNSGDGSVCISDGNMKFYVLKE